MFKLRLVQVLSVLAVTTGMFAQSVAQTPPMGWNSWDAYGLTITQSQFLANVKVLHDKLLPLGWNYAVIDEGWFFYNPQDRETPEKLVYAIDSNGRYVPVPARFPLAGGADSGLMGGNAYIEATSFRAVAEAVHRQGLKFGIHIVRGIPRVSVERNLPVAGSDFRAADVADKADACPWDPTNWGVRDNAAGQAWYDSLMSQYAEWGVDLLKVDCISDHPYKVGEIRMIRRAIDKAVAKTHRPVVLSLSPGPTQLAHAEEVAGLAQMWRVSDDVWDVWSNGEGKWPAGVVKHFDYAAQWAAKAKPGAWPDEDMLPLGRLGPSPGWGKARTSRLTLDEQRTLMTLWAMSRSPLIVGANLTEMDDATLKLLTNRDLITIDQRAVRSWEHFRKDGMVVWRASLPGGREAEALFNLGDKPVLMDEVISAAPAEKLAKRLALVDVWTGKRMGKMSEIPAHGSVFLKNW